MGEVYGQFLSYAEDDAKDIAAAFRKGGEDPEDLIFEQEYTVYTSEAEKLIAALPSSLNEQAYQDMRDCGRTGSHGGDVVLQANLAYQAEVRRQVERILGDEWR